MKKIFATLSVLVSFTLFSQIINFPDPNLKTKLLTASPTNTRAKNLSGSFFKIDANNDGEIQVSEATQVSYIDVDCTQSTCQPGTKITNLQGISSFVNLEFLNCGWNSLTTTNILSNTSLLPNLKTLKCYCNNLSGVMNVSTFTSLESLDFSGNYYITDVNVSGLLNLKELNCGQNNISQLNLSNTPNLEYLKCYINQLTTLDVSALTNLKELEFYSNTISSINLNGLTNLEKLSCRYNQLSSLDLSGHASFRYLDCQYNAINTINIQGSPNILYLQCDNNQISNLDVSECTLLTYLKCDNNLIANLNITTHDLDGIEVHNNQLTTLDIAGNPNIMTMNCRNNQLVSIFAKGSIFTDVDMGDFFSSWYFNGNPGLQYFCCDDSREAQVRARVVSYGYADCVVNSYCSFVPGGEYYTLQGNHKFDGDNNGCDASDALLPYLKYNITGGSATATIVSNASGNYFIPVQAGLYTLTPIIQNPAFFTISPNAVNVNFPTQVSPVIQNFCIAASGIHPDLEIVLLPRIARPGFNVTYSIIYKNKGTQTQSGAISLTFNDAVLDFVTSNPAVTSQVIDNLTWNFTNLQPFESRAIVVTLNVNSPSEVPPISAGDILSFTTSINSSLIDEMPNDNTFVLNQTVVNSFDPNDKTCLEGNTITPEMVGKEVHYLIRFENTGTGNAENIVVRDLIDTTKFDINSLIPIDGSHPFVTKISNTNKVEFIFENINLPFDDANNDGYVAFKIKTKPNLVLGNTFSNTASIYFDYNFPIVTNTATTTVALLAKSDFVFENYFSIYPNPANDVLNINTKQAIEVTSINIYNALGQVVLVIPNAQQTMSVDVSSLKTGNYFLKINSNRGSSSVKFLKM